MSEAMVQAKFKVGDRVVAPAYCYEGALTVTNVCEPSKTVRSTHYFLHGVVDTFFWERELRAATTEEKVIGWAAERGLLEKSRSQCLAQSAKTEEKVGKFLEAINAFDDPAALGMLYDDCVKTLCLEAGDILVTLTIQLHIHGHSIAGMLQSPMKPLGCLQEIMMQLTFGLDEYAPHTPNIGIHCSRLCGWLAREIKPYGLSLEECLEAAYEKIAER